LNEDDVNQEKNNQKTFEFQNSQNDNKKAVSLER